MKKLPFFCNEGVLNFMKEETKAQISIHSCVTKRQTWAPTFQQHEKENLSRTYHHSLA